MVLKRHLSNPSDELREVLTWSFDESVRQVTQRRSPIRTLQPQSRLDAAAVASLVERYVAGAKVKELAAEFGIKRETVTGHLERAKIKLRVRGLTERQGTRAVALYAEGWSTARIGKRFGVDDKTVATALKKYGVVLRKPWERI